MASVTTTSQPVRVITPPMEKGLAIFNLELTSDPKKRIGTTTQSNSQHIPCTLHDLLRDYVILQEKRAKQKSTTWHRVENVIKTINTHSKVIDVLIQQQPDITSVVWGAFRFLIGIAVQYIQTSEKISDALTEILNNLGRWNQYFDLFNDFERVNDAAARLFSQIINFSVRARIFYGKNITARYFKFGLTTSTQKIDDIMDRIREYGLDLEREANLASEFKREQDRKVRNEHITRVQRALEQQSQLGAKLSQDVNTVIESLKQDNLKREQFQAVHWLLDGQPLPLFKPEPEEGTCLWVPRCEVWSNWVESVYSKPIVICGPPGSGKSTIANHLSKSTETNFAIIHFFRGTTNKEQAKCGAFAAALLSEMIQLEAIQMEPQYAVAISRIIALSNRRVVDVKFSELWLVISELLPCLPEFTVIVDGLDECDEASRALLASQFMNFSLQPNVRLIVTFRHHPQLDRAFKNCPTIQLTPTTSSHDIRLYVNAEIQRHGSKLLRLKKETIDTIMSSCYGMFLWAEMMLKCLKAAHTYNEQLAYLKSPPPNIYAFYERLNRERTETLTVDDNTLRRNIFVILVGIYQPLTCKELFYLLSLEENEDTPQEADPWTDSEATVLYLCWPLVRVSDGLVHLLHGTVKEFFTQPPPQTIPSIHIPSDEAEAHLAAKCLAALTQEKYRSINTIAILVRKNVGSVGDTDEPYFYRYAATHWYTHLIAIRQPEASLVQQAANFLLGYAFVSWSEFIFQISGSQGTILEVEAKLKIWRRGLSSELREIFILESYFSGSYRDVAATFQEDGGDKTLSYMTLFQLGEFYNLSSRPQEAFEVKQIVAKALVDLLGEQNPLALKAQSAFAWEYMTQNRFLEAEATFRRLAQIQEEVLGTDKPDTFVSLQRQGCAELYMTKFAQADLALTRSLSGFLNTVGVGSFYYLLSRMAFGQVSEYQGNVMRANLEYEHVWRYRTSLLGPDNSMAVWAHCSMVSTYRKLKRYDEADEAVEQVINSRMRTLGEKSLPTIDAIIHRAILYLDMERLSESMELVDFILDGGLVDEDFERSVQINHVRALVEFFMGKVATSIETLQSLISQSLEIGLDGRVRSLLWVRLDLASLLRKAGREDDALILFDELVTSIDSDSSSSWEEVSQSCRELIIAERALELVRRMREDEARLLLESKGLKWFRQKDFWIPGGYPPADTAWVQEPYRSKIPVHRNGYINAA